MAQLEIYRNGVLVDIKKVDNLTQAKKQKKIFYASLRNLKAKHLIKETEVFYSIRKKI